MIRSLFVQLDNILRGGLSRRDDLRAGRVPAGTRSLLATAMLLGSMYGVFMGLYAVLRPKDPNVLQLISTTFKVPLLFLLTLLVTLPSLYVFSALANSRLRAGDTLRLLLVGIVVNVALLASFGPITAFFTLSTESYYFMVVLNVIFFVIGGLCGLVFLRKALDVVFEPPASDLPMASPEPPRPNPEVDRGTLPQGASARPRVGGVARRIFYVWILIYGVVGAQMGWILRPFIGSPDLPFTLFRERESNFFVAVFESILHLFE